MWFQNNKARLFQVALLLSVTSAFAFAAEDGVFYLQAANADLKQAPKMSSGKVGELRRGDRLVVLEKTEKWYRVRKGQLQGWVPRLFLSSHKPVGQAELSRDIPVNLEKASRRRPPSYTVSAATRGLLGDAPSGRKKGDLADYEALGRVERSKPTQAELDKFGSSAKLKTE